MKIRVKADIPCSFCSKPIQDLSKATLFWCDPEQGEVRFGVAHWGECDAPENWKSYRHSKNLHRLIAQPEELCALRKYLNVKISGGELTREAVTQGLEQFLVEVPAEFFDLGERSA